MNAAAIDEIEAFKLARATAAGRNWPWRPPFWLALADDQWSVRSEGEYDVRIDATSGEPLPEAEQHAQLDPVEALSIARDFAIQNGQSWKPCFALELTPTHWIVGARQGQFGGQLTVEVDHSGAVVASRVNPK